MTLPGCLVCNTGHDSSVSHTIRDIDPWFGVVKVIIRTPLLARAVLLAEIPRVIFRGRGYTGEAILVKGVKVNIGHSLNDGEEVVVVCVCECRCHGFIIAEGSDIVKS